ncbi:PREDICTED: protein cereblon-like isoform X2 [Acropora digitifera]|uniref:protein cereblon-like isoform X2 n=1 Tax=Acropora digitifera TaxID=70779 RepID=UPI00077B1CE9|nr:PREDICTED: protein cereblon-like isoform X2 [Acropora digitifera]
MADDSSSDEDIDVQNGYDGEPDIFLPGGSGSDTTDSPAEIVQDSDGEESDAINFDPSLPAQHQYLGEEMDEFSGRTYHEPGSHVTLPLLMRPDLVLVPGQTLPLHLFRPQIVSMIKNIIEKDRTFGLVNSRSTGNHNQLLAAIGTTVEIFSMKEENEAGICTLRIKATGRQRFRIKELRRQVDGVLMATVHVLPEVTLPSHPEGSLLSCYHKFGCQATTHGQLDKISTGKNRLGKTKCKRVAISLSSWPRWVYQQYNPYVLMEFIKKELKSWSDTLCLDNVPKTPTEFSFWVAANMPLDDDLRLQVLGIDCPTQRLRRELEIVRKCGAFCCSECDTKIAEKGDLFSMSLDGPLGAYVNPNGCVHETLTFYRAKSFRLRGRHTTENSWFPGYAWTIAECAQCGNHLGWRFTAVKRGLSPSKFWGLTRKALKPTLTYEEGNDHSKACSPPTPS